MRFAEYDQSRIRIAHVEMLDHFRDLYTLKIVMLLPIAIHIGAACLDKRCTNLMLHPR